MPTTIGRVSGVIAAANQNDWYSVTFTTTQSLDLDLTLKYGSATIYLYDSLGNRVNSDSGYTTSDAWLNNVVAAGTYYIDVTGSAAGYTLTTSLGLPATGSATVDTAGQTTGTARALGTLGATTVSIAESIGGTDPYDYYSFNLATVSQLKLTISGLLSGTTLYLLNAAGQQIAYTTASSTTNGSLNTTLPPLTAGAYYLEVSNSSSAPSGYNLGITTVAAVPSAGPTTATARSMGTLGTVVQTYTDAVNPVTPAEYYSFTVSGPSRVNFSLSGLTDSALIRLRDASGATISTQYGNFDNGSVYLSDDLNVPASGTYYISVETNGGSAATSYTLSASAAAIQDNGGNSFATAGSLGTITTATTTVTDYIGTVDPADYFSFTLASAATLSVTLSAYFRDVPNSAQITLYTSNDVRIGSTYTAYQSASALPVYNLAAGQYFALVAPYSSYNDTNYTLSLTTSVPTIGTSAVQNAGTTLATAANLGVLTATGVSIADWVGTGNTADWYGFTVASPGIAHISLTGTVNSTNVYLTGITGTVLASDTGTSSTGGSIGQYLAAGTYYIEVTTSSTTAGYHLSASVQTIADSAGGTMATALNIGALGPTTETFNDYVGTLDNHDYYEFTLSGLSTVEVHLGNLATSTTVYIRDVSGNSIIYTSGAYNSDAGLQRVLAAGTYFIDVYGTSPSDYTLNLSANPLQDTAGSLKTTAAPILPTAASVVAQLDTLEAEVKAGIITSISLSDPGVPTLTLSYAQVVADADALKAIATPYRLNISGTAEKFAGPTLQALGFGGTSLLSVQFADGRLVFDVTDPAAQVYRMYLSAFGRVPDPAGMHLWSGNVESGESLAAVAQAFIGSAEFTARYGTSVSDTQFITLLYQNVLGRAPDPGGLAGWQSALAGGLTRAQALVSFSESAEHIADTAPGVQAGLWDLDENAAEVARLYDTVFGRLPDTGGLAGWASALRAGTQTLSSVAAAFVSSAEFQAVYGSLSNTAFVTTLYANALHRAADAAGLNNWVSQLNAGLSRASVVLAFSESAEHQADTASNILNPSLSQQGILTIAPVVAAGSVIGADLDQLETLVTNGTVPSITTSDSGVAAVPITTAQLISDKDALGFIRGSYDIDLHTLTSGSAGAAVLAANLGNTTTAKYVQFADGRLVFDTSDRAAEVYRLYDSAFGRAADTGGEHYWSQALTTTALSDVAQAFIGSAEFIARYGSNVSDNSFVTLLYQNVLHRAPDTGGLNNWLSALGNGYTRAQVLVSFSESAEHVANTSAAVHAGIFDIG